MTHYRPGAWGMWSAKANSHTSPPMVLVPLTDLLEREVLPSAPSASDLPPDSPLAPPNLPNVPAPSPGIKASV